MKRQIFSCLLHQTLKKLLVLHRPLRVPVNSFQASAIGAKESDSQKSKDYFKHKLLQFGIGTKVPIETLFCYYNSAPPEFRNISRHRIKEFKIYLSKHPDTFEVVGDSVLLVGSDDIKNVPHMIKLEGLCANNCPKSGMSLSRPIIGTSPSSAPQSNHNTQVITATKDSKFVTDAIMHSGEQIVVSLDCEGINLGAKGKLSLIQLGTTRGEALIFDVQHCPQIMMYGGLKSLLESENVIKIMHDCRGDSANLFAQFHTILRNVFDTQAAQVVLEYQEQGKQMCDVDQVSLNKLCELYNARSNTLKDKMKKEYVRNPNYWAKRPLSSDMLRYAAEDVLVLINEQVYGTIASAIKPQFKTLLSELCAERILKTILPSEVESRVKQRNESDIKKKLMSTENVVMNDREIEFLKSLDLTEDEKEKLRSVEKELDKLGIPKV